MDAINLWQNFAKRHSLTDHQIEQFKQYYELLVQTNELFNITAITELSEVLYYHFDDSLILGKSIDLSSIKMLADVGTGAGFPAIPLKIKYPHLALLLIEVSNKKALFLEELAEKLELSDVEVCTLDWRTFLRKTEYPIEIFCARASLQPEELLRMFQPSSPYKDAKLIYWASNFWQPFDREEEYMSHEFDYVINDKKRKLIFFDRHFYLMRHLKSKNHPH